MSEPATGWEEVFLPDLSNVATEDDEPADNLSPYKRERAERLAARLRELRI